MFYTKKARAYADGRVYAVDTFFPEAATVKDGIICVNDIGKLPDNEFDCIIMMDVLEHIENEKPFFDDVVNKLKDGGTVLITVPAWQFLFSIHDTRSQHYRRYNRKQLLAILEHNCIKVKKCHYFYTSLFFARVLYIQKKEKFTGNEIDWKYSEKNIITVMARVILDMDFWVNMILDRIGIHLPGLSLMAVCMKKIDIKTVP